MALARVNDIDIWHEISRAPGGSASADLLVLTHGFAGPSAGWRSIVDDVKARYDVLTYDVRAHGRTTVPDDGATVNVPQFAADLAGLLDHLGVARAHIAGVSMGGMISAQFACDCPDRVRSLLLCDTTAGNGAGPDEAANEVERYVVEAFSRLAHIAEKYGMAELVRREKRYRHEGDPYVRLSAAPLEEHDANDAQAKLERMTQRGYLLANKALRERPDLTARTPAIAAPTLVSCGVWDRFYPCARRDARLIPGARLVSIEGAAHDTLWYQPESWKRAVLEFLADVEAGRDVAGEITLAPTHVPAAQAS
jgi:3-oxoadipate enol-lactonase